MILTYAYQCPAGHINYEKRSVDLRNLKGLCNFKDCENQTFRLYTAPGVSFKGTGFYANDKNSPS